MRMRCRTGWVVAGVLACIALARAQVPDLAGSTAPSQSAPAPLDARWMDMVAHFASSDFTERQDAQKQLDQATWRDAEDLAKLAKLTPDPEAKARIEVKLQAIAEATAINPPPLTLHVKDKSLSEITDILARQMKIKLDTWPPNQGGGQFTLDVVDKSYWEVLQELNKQAPIAIQGFDGIRLMPGEPGMRNMVVSGPLAVMPMSITRSKTVNLQGRQGEQVGKEQLTLQFWTALDPRVQVVKYQQPALTEVLDDAGNALVKRERAMPPNFWAVDGGRNRVWQGATVLELPANLGKKITTAKGELTVMVQLAEAKMEIEDVEKELKKPVTIAGQTLTIQQFEVRNNSIHFDMRREQIAPVIRMPGMPAPDTPAIRVTFIDVPTGTRIWSTTVQGGSSGNVGSVLKGPVKIEISVATKVEQKVIPFEMKDLALP